MDVFEGCFHHDHRLSDLVSGICQDFEIYDSCLRGYCSGVWNHLHPCIRETAEKWIRMSSNRQTGSCLYRRNPVFCGISSLDLSGRISSGSSWNREVYGLWLYGSNDAQQDPSGNRSLVFPGQDQLLLWRSVLCSISDKAFRHTGGAYL